MNIQYIEMYKPVVLTNNPAESRLYNLQEIKVYAPFGAMVSVERIHLEIEEKHGYFHARDTSYIKTSERVPRITGKSIDEVIQSYRDFGWMEKYEANAIFENMCFMIHEYNQAPYKQA